VKPFDEASEPLSQTARDILAVFHRAHRRPGARMRITRLTQAVALDPAVITVAISELVRAGYVTAPDVRTVELTAAGFDHIALFGPEQPSARRTDEQA
jgi:hypothetical protein